MGIMIAMPGHSDNIKFQNVCKEKVKCLNYFCRQHPCTATLRGRLSPCRHFGQPRHAARKWLRFKA